MNKRYNEAAIERSKIIQHYVIYYVLATFIYLVGQVFFMLCLLELNPSIGVPPEPSKTIANQQLKNST
jgi:hypothetical protein